MKLDEVALTKEQAQYALWLLGDLSYLYEEGQKLLERKLLELIDAAGEDVDEVILLCSRRYGKSFYSMLYLFSQCLKKEGLRTCVIGPSMEDAKKIMNPIITIIMGLMPSEDFANRKTSNYVIDFHNGSSIVVAGADVGANKVRGRGFDLVICEETGDWDPSNYDMFMKNILRPTLIRSKEKIKIIHATTPSASHIDHPLHALFDKLPTVRLTVYDNPKFDDKAINKIINDCGGLESHAYQVEYLCKVTRNEQMSILPDFDDARHVVEPVDVTPYYVLGSFDAGGTRDRSAYVEGVLYKNQIRIIHAKDWPPMTSIDEISEYLLSRKADKLIGDLSGQVEIEYSLRGLHFTFPSKTEVETMLIELNSAFRKDEIVIEFNDDNICLAEQCQAAQFNRTRTDYGRTEAFGHCDLVSALNYLYRMKKFLQGAKNNYYNKLDEAKALSNNNSNAYYHMKAKINKRKKNLEKLVRR